MAHFALLWKARTIEKYRQNYENEKYLSIRDTNTPMPQKSLSQRLRCYRQDTQKRFSKIFQKIYPEGSSLSNFFLYLRTDQTCLNFVLKSLLGFLIGLGLTYLCFLFLMFQLSISLFHATIVSSIIGVLLTMGLAFSYRIRCLIFLLLPQFFSRAGRYTLTCYALVLILTGPATNTLKNSEVLSESMACRQEQIKSLVNEIRQTMRKPLNSMRDSLKIMVQKIEMFAKQLKQTLLKVNRLTLSVLETIQSTFSWLQWLSNVCNKIMGSPFERCLKVLKQKGFDYDQRFESIIDRIRRLENKAEEICSSVKDYRAICVFTDFVNGSFVATIKRRLKDFSERIKNMLYLQIHVHHSYSFSSNTSHSASQVAAGIVTEIRKRADPLLTWLSWSSCVTSLFLLLIIFRAKYYQHMFETRSRFDNKYITKELRDLDLKRLRHGRETILPLNRRERSKYVSTTSFRLVASEKIHLNRSIVFMAITTFKLLIHMIADYSLYWVLMTIRYHGNNQTPLPFGVPNAGMHITGTGRIADMFRSLLMALTFPLETPKPLSNTCLPDPHPPNLKRYTQIGILIFLLWFFALFEPYGLRLRHVIMGLYRPERAKARAEWLYNHILRTRGGFMKFARRKLHRSYKYCTEEKYTFKRWLNEHIPFCWIRYLLGIPSEEAHCFLCGTKEDPKDPIFKLQKCHTQDCPGVYCCSCFSDIGELCTICLSPRDYGDLSDVSLEKGSSDDESDDDSEGNEGGEVVPKNDDEREQVIFENESDNMLLPKPLRDNSQDQNDTKKSERHFTIHTSNVALSRNFGRKTFVKVEDPLKVKEMKTHLYPHLKKNIQSTLGLINTNCLFSHFSWKISVKSSLKIIHMTVSEDTRETRNNIKKSVSITKDTQAKYNYCSVKNSFEEKHTKNNDGRGEQKQSTQIPNPPVPKDRDEKKHGKEKKSDENNIDREQKESNEKDNNDNHTEHDKMDKNEQELTSYCCFNQFNIAFCSYLHTIKNNLLNGCSLLAGAVINNTLGPDDKNNYKTRKKDSLDLRDSTATENKNSKDSRQYRIFTFLAEQEWVIKKTVRYENTEEEFSLLNEGCDIKPTDKLKQDLYSQAFNYKELSFECTAECTTPNSQGQWTKPNQNTRNEPSQLKPNKKPQIYVCGDCNCSRRNENPFTQSKDKPVTNTRIKKSNHKPTNRTRYNESIIITQVEAEDSKCKTVNNKISIGEKIRGCLKSMFCPKKKTDVICACGEESSKTHADHKRVMTKNKHRLIDQEAQFDKCDCAIQNRAIQANEFEKYHHHVDHPQNIENCAKFKKPPPSQTKKIETPESCDCCVLCAKQSKKVGKRESLPQPKEKERIFHSHCDCDSSNQANIECSTQHSVSDESKKKENSYLLSYQPKKIAKYNFLDYDSSNENEQCSCACNTKCDHISKKIEKCDPLCPDECECKGHGYKEEKCDPLCPVECECGGQWVREGKCDELCPEECCCKESHQTSADTQSYPYTNKAKVELCSCAVQYATPEQSYESGCCSCCDSLNRSYTVSLFSEDSTTERTLRSDFTGTDTIIELATLDMPRIKRPRYVVTKCNQYIGTETPIKYNIGTITDEKGLVRKNRFYLPGNKNGDKRVVKQRVTVNRGVCTKKVVAFKSQVQFIPRYSYGSSLDIYSPSRYLIESQKYYNELFAMNSYMPNVYLMKKIQKGRHRRSSSQGGSRCSRKGHHQSKQHEESTALKRKQIVT